MRDQQVIIFEGCDKVGKTEMAKELSKRLSIPYFKNTSEWAAFENDKDYFINALRYSNPYFFSFLNETKTSVILDRSYPSEWAYSCVYNRQTDIKALNYLDELAAEQLKAKIIIPYRTSYVGLKDDVHDIDSDKLQEISDTYVMFSKWTKCDVLRFCIDSEDIEYEMKTIMQFLSSENEIETL